jgi:NCAIR mutase (PurE)-related protein
VYAPGKTPEQVAAIAVQVMSRSERMHVTRLEPAQWQAMKAAVPSAEFHARARAATVEKRPRADAERTGRVVVLSAGTADEPVAEEARVTALAMGAAAEGVYDCGVAGLHRLLRVLPTLRTADAVVVVAGMEGALPSVVGGLLEGPVIAVPTSVGYGASFEGIGPLLTMLNSCAAGVAVVNIDNGFGAGYLAAVIARKSAGADRTR